MKATEIFSDPKTDPWLKNALASMCQMDPDEAVRLAYVLFSTVLEEVDYPENSSKPTWKTHG
jgi:hypothetical protein